MRVTLEDRKLTKGEAQGASSVVENSFSNSVISVAGLSKRFERPGGELVMAIDDVSLEVQAGELVVLLGPSGCGKTTLLRCLAGLESPDKGEIMLESSTVYSSTRNINIPTEKRDAAMLFQSYALWPHMTVFENVAFPLRTARKRRFSKTQIAIRVHEVLAIVNCSDLAAQYPGEISGGQQQRVALARAIASDEPIVYFDEPLSNIDSLLRDKLRIELKELQRKVGFSAIYVTHDQQEALTLADRIVVLKNGKIAQVGTPREVFEQPNSAYVASFMGSVNEVPGLVRRVDGTVMDVSTEVGDFRFSSAESSLEVGDQATVMCRPAKCEIRETLKGSSQRSVVAEGVVRDQIFLGTRTEVIVDVGDRALVAWAAVDASFERGQKVWFVMPQESSFVVRAEGTEPNLTVDSN